jgi:GMP synthase (glutamine-hydrolysing)
MGHDAARQQTGEGVSGMRVHYLMHASFETPGIIEKWAQDRGYAFDGTRTYSGGKLPKAADVDFLIVMGGPQSATRLDNHPYLRDEINLISGVISLNKPLVGFCLGSQLIAEALGAPTKTSPNKEVGFFPVQLTDEGRQDSILGNLPSEFEVLHWHYDMPSIPTGAALLARSAGCPHQAFRYGDRTYGFQFHMEPTEESIKPLLENAAEDLAPGRYTQTSEEILSADFEAMNQRMILVLDSLTKLTI